MNLSGILKLLEDLPAYERLIEALESQSAVPPLAMPMRGRAPLLVKLFLDRRVPVVLLTGRVDAVSTWQQAIEAWLPPGRRVLRFPEPTPLPYDRGPWSDRSRLDRLAVLTQLVADQHPLIPASSLSGEAASAPLIVTSARALAQKTLPKRRFLSAMRVLRPGQLLDFDKLLEGWTTIGYEPVSVVEAPGQFSRRGGILDIYPTASPLPARIELFGDEIDTLRYFDPTTQRSTELSRQSLERLVVPPAREAMPGELQPLGERLAAEAIAKESDLPAWQDDIEALAAGQLSPHLEYYLPLAYPQPAGLLDYLPDNALVVVDDCPDVIAALTELLEHSQQIANEQPGLPPNYPSPLFTWDEIATRLHDRPHLILGEDEEKKDEGERMKDEQESSNSSLILHPSSLAEAFQPGPRYGGQVRPLMTQLKYARAEHERTVVASSQASRLAELWRDATPANAGTTPIESLADLPPDDRITFVQGGLAEGFILERQEEMPPGYAGLYQRGPEVETLVNLLTDAEIFGWHRPAPSRRRAPRSIAPETYFADIAPGDFIVHSEFGIGRFTGLVVRSIGGTDREYLQVKYANSDVLYVPVHHADRLSKWIGPDERPPDTHRLGEKTWRAAKQKAQEAADELAGELMELYSARLMVAGHAYSRDSEWQAELEASFPYQETEDQLRAISEVKNDMERPQPMDRLICGDVGYGKTEVALRAAFKAVNDNKQVAILTPTTVLAQQHYNTFTQRLSAFPVTIEMLSRFRTHSQQERIIRRLREGGVDIIIGTHRLLSDDVSFKDLGLLIIDEEQRFGVADKEKLKQFRTEVDVLTLTATPIPRTMYMGLSGARDISVIETAPAERLPVQTYVGEQDDALLRRAILRELDRGGQIFFVHNRVQSIDNVYQRLQALVPDAVIAVGHGQMSERDLEEVMTRFVQGQVDILLCTTIIESGLDIPNANTLIVDHAEQFGLAQLYQLRGRVGRGTRRAYAYFFHPAWRKLTPDAQSRLETIEEHSQLGAGYSIAMRDLEIRGAGDLLGARQSGHIAAIGFDLYTRMLAQAVKKRKAIAAGEEPPPDPPDAVLIDVPLAAYIPTDYVPDAALRLRLYRRMAVLDTLEEIDEMAAELADRFGAIPDPVDNLLYQLRIKVLATKAGVTAVTTEAGQIQIRLPDMENLNRFRLQRFLGQSVRVSRKGIWLPRELSTHEWQIALVQLLEKVRLFDREAVGGAAGDDEQEEI